MTADAVMVRARDGSVRVIDIRTLSMGETTPRLLPLPARSLVSGASCYLAAADGHLVCPFEGGRRRVAVPEGARSVSIATAVGCVVRADGSVGCRDSWERGRFAVIGDGLLGPRYREADVLGFAPLRAHTTGSSPVSSSAGVRGTPPSHHAVVTAAASMSHHIVQASAELTSNPARAKTPR